MQNRKLSILIVTQYFWPENMRINDLVKAFIAKGHEVTVLTGKPNYPEGRVFKEFSEAPEKFSNYCGATVVRIPMVARGKTNITLSLNYISFFLSATLFGYLRLRNKKFDSIFVFAASPIFTAIPAIVIGFLKKAVVFVWVLDLWPESLSAVGVVQNKMILKFVGKVVSWIYNRTDYILMQSRDFQNSVMRYCTKAISHSRLIYFPNWAEEVFLNLPKAGSGPLKVDDNTFTILFAGNLGECQDLPSVLNAVEKLAGVVPVRWVFVGDGRMSGWLQEQVSIKGLSNVMILGRHPLEAMPSFFASADALFVSLKVNEVFEKTIPGKVQAYLAAGRPIIAMLDGEGRRVIEESRAGFACRSGDVDALVRMVSSAARMPSHEWEDMGKNGRRYYLENFSREKLFDRLELMFLEGSMRRKQFHG